MRQFEQEKTPKSLIYLGVLELYGTLWDVFKSSSGPGSLEDQALATVCAVLPKSYCRSYCKRSAHIHSMPSGADRRAWSRTSLTQVRVRDFSELIKKKSQDSQDKRSDPPQTRAGAAFACPDSESGQRGAESGQSGQNCRLPCHAAPAWPGRRAGALIAACSTRSWPGSTGRAASRPRAQVPAQPTSASAAAQKD